MVPSSGGEADKFGNRYEGRWTVSRLLFILLGHLSSIVVERRGERDEDVEFLITRNDGLVEAHQVKRQRRNQNGWSVLNLREVGVLAAAAKHAKLGEEFWFVSLVPCRDLDELSDRARSSDDAETFRAGLTKELAPKHGVLREEWGEDTFEILQRVRVSWPDERQLVDTNAALAELLLTGADGRAAAAALGDLVLSHPGKLLDAATIEARLADYGLARAQLTGTSATAAVRRTYTAWAEGIAGELLQPEIRRSESDGVVERLRAMSKRVLLVTGHAGAGKSSVLHQAVGMLAEEWPVLALRLDEIPEFSSTHELGVERLGLSASPAVALAAAAQGRECLLVIDQLDAVSLASGRMPTTFNHVAALLREAQTFDEMRVLMACREFDVDNDHRLRALIDDEGPAERFHVDLLDIGRVANAVRDMGLDPTMLTSGQHELLRIPLNLVLLKAVADQPGATAFSTPRDLMRLFYERKRQDCDVHAGAPIRFSTTIETIASHMSERQRLYVPEAALDADNLHRDAGVMASEHVLVRDGTRIRFFHETFFDYVFARGWLTCDESLTAFLLAGEQELFRRTQVRQVLLMLRPEEPERFIVEVGELLGHPKIRFHIKDVVIASLRALDDPSDAEWRVVERLIGGKPPFADRLWTMLRTAAWFDRVDSAGVLAKWLSGDDEHFNRAIDIMVSSARDRPAQVAARLSALRADPRYDGALRHITRFADLEASRELLDVVLEGVRRGVFDDNERDLFMSADGLGEHNPVWACELLCAWLVERPDALELNGLGQVKALESRDAGPVGLVANAAAAVPLEFVTFAVPYLLEVMALTESEHRRPFSRQFRSRHMARDRRHRDLGDALLIGVRDALRQLVAAGSHDVVEPFLQKLTTDQHDAAQWLLYETFAADGQTYAGRAFALLTAGDERLYCSYGVDPFWCTRQLVRAIASHLDDEQLERLEVTLAALRPAWEDQDRPRGQAAWTLLSALPAERLTDDGRRRVQELQRLFGQEPDPPGDGFEGGSVRSPISASATDKMSDAQWLGAFAKYAHERERFSGPVGGADELATELRRRAQAEPERFAALGLQLGEETHPAYMRAIVSGVAESPEAETDVVLRLVRHVDQLDDAEYDLTVLNALRGRLDDLRDGDMWLLLDRALHSSDPEGDGDPIVTSNDPDEFADPYARGMNTVRGFAALLLGDALVHDPDGRRTALVAPSLDRLARDPSLPVRACVGHLVGAAFQHARPQAVAALDLLVAGPDALLASDPVQRAVVFVGFSDPERALTTIARMLASFEPQVRRAGGGLAAFAALEWDAPYLLTQARSADVDARRGAAVACANRVPVAAVPEPACEALVQFFDDPEKAVREDAAEVAAALRDRPLDPHRALLEQLIGSRALDSALPQLLITLEHATEAVDDLILQTGRRFLEVHHDDLSDFANTAHADSREVGELALRAYAQARAQTTRRAALDVIDDLLAADAYNLARLVDDVGR